MRSSVKAWFAVMRLLQKQADRNECDSLKIAKAQRNLADTIKAEINQAKKAGAK